MKMTREMLLDALALDTVMEHGEKGVADARALLLERKRLKAGGNARSIALQVLVELAEEMNRLPNAFFESGRHERMRLLRKSFNEKSFRGRLFISFLSQGTYPSLMRRIGLIAKTFGRVHTITVQTASDPSLETKERMMKHLKKKDAPSLVVFTSRPSLLRGMRLFHEGRLVDRSARGKLTSLLQSI
jgi:F0F1-type ATP synthase delta subunit